jgi:hypothetical protein
MMQQGHTNDAHEPLHHEESDVDSRAIFRFGGWLVVVMVGVYAAVWLIFGAFDRREASGSVRDFPLAVDRNELPPQPRLQIEPRQELRDLQQRDEALLNSYGWADREAGLVRIPIAEAMRLTVERGLPVRAASPVSEPPAATSTPGGATR